MDSQAAKIVDGEISLSVSETKSVVMTIIDAVDDDG
jgi:hypothetical protein